MFGFGRISSIPISIVCCLNFLKGLNAFSNENNAINIALIGDSLFQHPVENYDILTRFQKELYPYNVTFVNYAIYGTRISSIRENFKSFVSAYQESIDGYLLFWDTDCSDIDESGLSVEDQARLRTRYIIDLVSLVQQIQTTGSFFAIGGPALLGEGFG